MNPHEIVPDDYSVLTESLRASFSGGGFATGLNNQFCGVKKLVAEAVSGNGAWLDCGGGSHPRGDTGFDIRDGVSFCDALRIYNPQSFPVVTAFGSLHSGLDIVRNTVLIPDTSDISILYTKPSLNPVRSYRVDTDLLRFHASCCAWWSSELVGITVRTRYTNHTELSSLASQFGMIQTEVFHCDPAGYTERMIGYYTQAAAELGPGGAQRLLERMYLLRAEYLSAPAVGVIWRR